MRICELLEPSKQLIPFPAGTTMVDVSDIYDWYKLGMIISDLDDANPEMFGKGPPHTAIVFGSEEEEHKLVPLIKKLGLRIHDIDRPEDVKKAIYAKSLIKQLEEDVVEEGRWARTLGTAAVAGALGFGAGQAVKDWKPDLDLNPIHVIKRAKVPLEDLIEVAFSKGLKGEELASFLAQMHHESGNFLRMEEKPHADDPYFHKYEMKYNPKKAKALGNTEPGDGWKYRGRGYVHLTGRYNYAKAGEALGLDLINNPDLAAIHKYAARIAIWYWMTRVRPKYTGNFDSTTRAINPGMMHAEERRELYQEYKRRMGLDDEEEQQSKK